MGVQHLEVDIQQLSIALKVAPRGAHEAIEAQYLQQIKGNRFYPRKAIVFQEANRDALALENGNGAGAAANGLASPGAARTKKR